MENIVTKADNVDSLSAAEFNGVQQEHENTITSTGQTLDGGNLFQQAEAVARYAATGGVFYQDSGVADAYVLSALGSFVSPAVYLDGMEGVFKTVNPSTGASTINMAGIGVKSFTLPDGTAISTQIVANEYHTVRFNDNDDRVELVHVSDGGPLNIKVPEPGAISGIVVVNDTDGAADTVNIIVNGTGNTGHALFLKHLGLTHAQTIDHQGTGIVSGALNVNSTNPLTSCTQISGNETSLGTLKITHIGQDDGGGTPTDTISSCVSLLANESAASVRSLAKCLFADGRLSDGPQLQIVAGDPTSQEIHLDVINGCFFGAATGGSQGQGTINAEGVFDDGVLLTCYVFEQFINGKVDIDKWDKLVPDKYELVPDLENEKGVNGIPFVSKKDVPREHVDLRKFTARIGSEYDPLDIDSYAKHWKEKGHLTSMPNEKNYNPEKGLSLGQWEQRLIETVEILAIHIEGLNERLKVQEAKEVAEG